MDARARALRYNAARARQCPSSLSPGITHPRPAASHPALIVGLPAAAASLLPPPARALATLAGLVALEGSRCVSRDSRAVSPLANTAPEYTLPPVRGTLGDHGPDATGRRGQVSRCAGRKRAVRATERKTIGDAAGATERLARSVTPRRSLSRPSLSRRRVGVDFPTRVSAAFSRPRSAALGRARRLGASTPGAPSRTMTSIRRANGGHYRTRGPHRDRSPSPRLVLLLVDSTSPQPTGPLRPTFHVLRLPR